MLMDILSVVMGLAAGFGGGYWFSQRRTKSQLEKNPAVNEKMIRAMYMQMGRKPSEAQIKKTMNAMKQHQ